MLRKSKKLNTKLHKVLIEKGLRKHSQLFSLQYMQYEEKTTRIAVVVPKKVSNKAVVRNKNKRIIFDIIKDLYPQLKENYCFAVVVRKDLRQSERKDLISSLKELLADILN